MNVTCVSYSFFRQICYAPLFFAQFALRLNCYNGVLKPALFLHFPRVVFGGGGSVEFTAAPRKFCGKLRLGKKKKKKSKSKTFLMT